ncbi:MAG: 16S rRNA (guanine(966)-N(2))-methyltransferase RsmD [Streptosporangiales bacterium]|nr:16S rRNA (guanine(966)-N(2))-methyltransferase RsmD [Streptosporangiales bacterium]
MTRIIAGAAGGRRLSVPPGRTTRPTSDRAREGLFGTVLSELGSLTDARVLDLYAGSGAVGLEALSRGAAHALLIELDPRAVQVIKRNVDTLRLPGAEVVTGRVERVLSRGPGEREPYDLVFADPPYAVSGAELTTVLESVRDQGWAAPGALVVVERATRDGEPSWPSGYAPDRARRYGEASLWYGHAADKER